MTSGRAEEFLLSLPRFTDAGHVAYKPGLERIRQILDAMGNPHDRFRSIHVAGTNGKGSTASMITSIGSSLGLRIGLHTSPHLVRITERMRIDGAPAPDEWLDSAVDMYRDGILAAGASFFEATVALSFLFFAENEVDFAVVEVGMGGRLDATNVLMPEVCVVTRIGLDHTEYLGNTLSEIAREKAGIAKRDRPLVLYPAPDEVVSAVQDVCVHEGAHLHMVEREVHCTNVDVSATRVHFSARTEERTYADVEVGLGGAHQVENSMLAIRAAELAWGGRGDIDEAIRNGLATVASRTLLRGRLEVLNMEPLIVADVAHNPDGLVRVLDALNPLIVSRKARLFVLFSVMADKDVSGLARLLARAADGVFHVQLGSARALDAASAVSQLRNSGVSDVRSGNLLEGLEWALGQKASDQDAVLVAGSHVLVGELMKLIEAGALSSFGTRFAGTRSGRDEIEELPFG